MKKMITTALTVSMVFTACALASCKKVPDAKTFNTYYEANRFDQVLSRYKTVMSTSTYYNNDQAIYTETVYLDNDQMLLKDSTGTEGLIRKDFFLYVYTDGRTPDTELLLSNNKQEFADYYYSYRNEGLFGMPDSETLIETTDKGGIFTAVTEDETKDAVLKAIDNPNMPENPYKYEDGMKVRFRYIIDKKTTDMIGLEAYIIDSQGRSSLLVKCESKFDVDKFDPATAEKSYKEFFRKLEENDVCNLTLVFSPGTDKENSVSYKVPHGIAYSIVYNEKYVQEVYTDKECTKTYKFEKPETELTLYIK